MKNKMIAIITGIILIGGCVSTSTKESNTLTAETTLVTSLVLGEVKGSERKQVAKQVYDFAVLVEKMINDGVSLSDIRKIALSNINNSTEEGQKQAILLSAILNYIDQKYQVNVNISDAEKIIIVKSAIDGVKQSASFYVN